MTRLIGLAALPLLLAAAPGHAQDAKAAIEAAAIAWESAFNAGDGKGVAELYTEDAALFPPGAERVDGKAAIAEFWQGAIDAGLADADLETVEVVEAGDLVSFGISHPCTTFDKWRLLYVVDDDYTVTEALRTFF